MLRLNIAAAIAGSSPSPKSLMNLAKWRSISANSGCVRRVGATFILNSEIGFIAEGRSTIHAKLERGKHVADHGKSRGPVSPDPGREKRRRKRRRTVCRIRNRQCGGLSTGRPQRDKDDTEECRSALACTPGFPPG